MAISTTKLSQQDVKDKSAEELAAFATANGVTIPSDEKLQTKKNLVPLLEEKGFVESKEEAAATEQAEQDAEQADEGYPSGTRFFVAAGIVPQIVTNHDPKGPDGESPSVDGSLVEATAFDPYDERVDGDRVISGFLATDDKDVLKRIEREDGTLLPGVVEVDEDEFSKRTDKARRVAS